MTRKNFNYRSKKAHNYRKPPPKIIKYCELCEKKTKFEYKKNIGHSECTECGFRWIKI